MKLSIVTINYNNDLGIEKTIKSIVSQSNQSFEYIIVDGESKDNSKNIIIKNEKYIDKWISEPDNGIYDAMNKGIQMASGEYILFINSGDWLYSNGVIDQVLPHLNNFSIIYGNLISYFSEAEQIINIGFAGVDITLKSFFQGFSLPHPATFHRKDLFEKHGLYDTNLKIVSDWKFFVETIVFKNESVNYIDIMISYFDMDGISNSNEDLLKKEQKSVLDNLITDKIYKDYLLFFKQEDKLNSKRFKKLQEIEKIKPAKKMINTFLNIVCFLFLRKKE